MGEFDKELFGKRLRIGRKSLGLTQKDLCKNIGLSQPNLAAYEAGRLSPPVEKLVLIADLLGVSLDYLCGRSNE